MTNFSYEDVYHIVHISSHMEFVTSNFMSKLHPKINNFKKKRENKEQKHTGTF